MGSSNEYMAAYMRERYHKKRAEIISRLGGKCVMCGSTDDLEVDHTDADSKSFEIAKVWNRPALLEPELPKCRLLCRACHRLKTTNERGQTPAAGTHGTLSSYRYCKCDLCKKAKSEHNRQYKLKKKNGG